MPGKDNKKAVPQKTWSNSIDSSGVRGSRSSRNGVYFFASVLFLIVFAGIIAICYSTQILTAWAILLAAVAALLAASSIRIVQQWEKAVVLRLGRFSRVSGPGLFFVIPVIEHVTLCIDQRIIATPFVAEEALTADLVSVDVDAVLFWMVWDAKRACIEVENYPKAVAWSAQTALRDAIGRVNLAELATRRKQIDVQLQETLGAKPSRGASLSPPLRYVTSSSPGNCRTPCPRRPRPSGNATPASSWRRLKKTYPKCLLRPPRSMTETTAPCSYAR
jgi:hypothetical protein